MKIRTIIFAFALIIAFIVGIFTEKKFSIHNVITKTDTIYSIDTIFSEKYVPKYYTKVQVDTIRDTVSKEKLIFNTDTVFVVKDYNTLFTYKDTLFKKNEFKLIIEDEIFQNRITSRKWQYQNLAPIIVNNTTINAENKRRLYLGLYLRSNDFYPNYSIYYLNRNKMLYTASFEPIEGVYSFGAAFRVFK